MVLESTFICVDNSDYMRNGDFIPSRLQSQFDAVNMVGIAKLKSNPENSIGILSLADNRVLVTLTSDIGKVLSKLHQVKPNGTIDFVRGIKVANLALKHRQGKNHKPRIVCFIASPVLVDPNELQKLAKRLKKEKVNVDLINFGEEEQNRDLLNEFINTINGKEGTGSHLVSIAAPTNLTDALFSSPILQGEDGSGLPAGFNPNFLNGMDDDPELAMALRISMEEQRLKQEAESKKPDGDKMDTDNQAQNPENALLQQALQLSLAQQNTGGGVSVQQDLSAMTEEEQLEYALKMSLAQSGQTSQAVSTPAMDEDMKEDDEDLTAAMNDPDFLQRVISELPGVDPNSDIIRSTVDSLNKDKSKEKDKDKK
jgi:26S proteasome regulatory subunit N10